MTISVKNLSAVFESVNSGNFSRVIQISANLWKCNNLYIEFNTYGTGEYSVQNIYGDDIIFKTFGDAVEYCVNI